MQKLFFEVGSLDTRCYETFSLSEELLMEHAAMGMASYIQQRYERGKKVLIVTGSGNNGADGIALARLLHKTYSVELFLHKEVQSSMGILQLKRSKTIGVKRVDVISEADVVVDAIFGSGLNRELDEKSCEIVKALNALNADKIACDIPSGIMQDGRCSRVVFNADVTLTMGALKTALFSDQAKSYVGEIKVIDLGVAREVYETSSDIHLLERSDMKLPKRTQQDTHKGSFGHTAVLAGAMQGAAQLAARAAHAIGSGLTTLVAHDFLHITPSLMESTHIPENTTAVAMGMGLGEAFSVEDLEKIAKNYTCVVDADLLVRKRYLPLIKEAKVITPHPKEFVTLLKKLQIADIDVATLQQARIHYAYAFSMAFPEIVLVLKGANVIIAHGKKIYINPHGSAILSKGGSGDVLAGFISGLLAQGYTPIEAAISGSLIHTAAAKTLKYNDYALDPVDLIEAAKYL